jgi:hypothetical protein
MGIYGCSINVQMSKCAYMQMKNIFIPQYFKTKNMGIYGCS